jgi:hypothetical protein
MKNLREFVANYIVHTDRDLPSGGKSPVQFPLGIDGIGLGGPLLAIELSDELSIQNIDETPNVVTCVGWDAYTGQDVAVGLDLRTGEILKATSSGQAESGVIERWRTFPKS